MLSGHGSKLLRETLNSCYKLRLQERERERENDAKGGVVLRWQIISGRVVGMTISYFDLSLIGLRNSKKSPDRFTDSLILQIL